MLGLLEIAAVGAAVVLAYTACRQFVRDRLRYVDAVQRRSAPWIAGAATAVVAAPVVWLLPVVGAGTAIALGAAVGTAVAHGARDVRRSSAGLLEP